MLNFDVEENRRRGLATEQEPRRYCGFVTPAQASILFGAAIACWGISSLFAPDAGQDASPLTDVSIKLGTDAAAQHGPQLIGHSKDTHGCLSSAGYSYCASSDSCVRPWSDSCPGGTQFCQEYCKKMYSDNEVGSMKVSCACGKGGEALDYAPPACTDLAPYRLSDMLSKCDDSVEAYAVVAGQCERLDGCSHALNAFATRSECESKCMEGTL